MATTANPPKEGDRSDPQVSPVAGAGSASTDPTITERLAHIETLLAALVERQAFKDYYEIEEFAKLVGREPFTCREWARHGRIRAEKKLSGRGAHARWVVSHDELLRYRRQGLLPLRSAV